MATKNQRVAALYLFCTLRLRDGCEFAVIEGVAAGAMLAMIGRTIFPAAFRKGGRDRGVGGPDGGLERRPTSAGSFADARRAPDRLPRAPGALSLRGCLKTNRALIDHTCARDDSGRSEIDRRVRQAQCPRKNRGSGLVANQTKLTQCDGTWGHPAPPWQNAHAEQIIGSIRRECFDHVIVLNERHLRRMLKEYLSHYHDCRTHISLSKDSPITRAVDPPKNGDCYTRLAA